ncbi:Flp pilus assembly protein CpaB [Nocardioides speluncae]|uniref:Flp pilus assembly protein CpaB n=1 Tax=Nocardioides speluncae TaxID=2670337 RepID=UPI000D6968F3|nr:Flp pilus assembly protein CpaB [Nocardioides speluncae]
MNPRQRRGVLFLAFAIVGAIAVFFAILSYVNDVESQVGNRVPGYVVSSDVEAYQELTAANFEKVDIPQRWLPDGAVTDLTDLVGRVSAAPLSKGTLLQSSNLIPKPSLEAGQREIAILIDAETGVAGKVRPGDHVDVWATFDEDVTTVGPRTKVIAQNLLVIDVGLQVQREKENSAGGVSQQDAVPITFATEEGQVKALTYAETFASQTRLVLRPPGDGSLVEPEDKTYVETFQKETS